MSNDIRDTITWVKMGEGTPEFPKGKSRVPVLLVVFDALHDSNNPLQGESIITGVFSDGKFMVYDSMRELQSYGGHDPITHWSYYPRTPQKILAPQAMW